MKRFVLKAGFFVAIQLAILGFVLHYGHMDRASNEYLYALKDKYELLQQTPSPRIIFVGGSNLAFGLDSTIVKSQLGLNPVNLGLHGSYGLFSMLRMVESELREGDIVVLAPEVPVMFDSPRCKKILPFQPIAFGQVASRFCNLISINRFTQCTSSQAR